MIKIGGARRVRWGKRAGVASGLVGMLSVLGELCFLLPDLLVTRDALPFYKENLAVFRGLLQATLLATFVLGAISILTLRSKAHGVIGIALGVVALLLGGSEAQPVEVGRRAFSVGLDYLVLELLVLGLVFVPLERLFALRPQNIFRAGWQTGSRMHIVDVFVTRAVGFLPVFVLGFAPPAVYAYVAFVSFHAVFIHANIRWRFPVVRWLLTTPQYHHWHHTCDEEGIDKNFASFLPALDVPFCTAHQPA